MDENLFEALARYLKGNGGPALIPFPHDATKKFRRRFKRVE